MKPIFVIFRKELVDTLRDRRTLVCMIAIPLLLFPILIGISSRAITSQVKKAQEKTLRVGLLAYGNAEEFRAMLLQNEKV
jgi:sodium transport system permease protein